MYKVSSNLSSTYGSEVEPAGSKRGPEMPHVTTGGHRMTNVQLGNGDIVQGIRRNGTAASEPFNGSHLAPNGQGLKPLRYTPGMACDPHLESLRPERNSKHQPFQGTDSWKKNLIPQPQTYEGSFVDADMQAFRPNPRTPVAADPWYTSRVPEPAYFPASERLAGAQFLQQQPQEALNPYEQIYPQDELSRIKMRNRRFLNSCGQEVAAGPAMGNYGPGAPMMMMVPPPMPPMQQQQHMMRMQPQQMQMMQQQQMPMMQQPMVGGSDMDELAILDQELNMTRRATRPFVPSAHASDYSALEKQRGALEDPTEVAVPRLKINPLADMPTSIDQLPVPKQRGLTANKAQGTVAAKPKPEVRIADQIAIRSLVLGKSLNKVGGGKDSKE